MFLKVIAVAALACGQTGSAGVKSEARLRYEAMADWHAARQAEEFERAKTLPPAKKAVSPPTAETWSVPLVMTPARPESVQASMRAKNPLHLHLRQTTPTIRLKR